MIDRRFTITTDDRMPHVVQLHFEINLSGKRLTQKYTAFVLNEARAQYPELTFDYNGEYSAKFPDGQYARCAGYRFDKDRFFEEIFFSMALGVDTILEKVTAFKKAVKPFRYKIDAEDLLCIRKSDLMEILEDKYSKEGICLRIKDIVISNTNEHGSYDIQPTEYDYV